MHGFELVIWGSNKAGGYDLKIKIYAPCVNLGIGKLEYQTQV